MKEVHLYEVDGAEIKREKNGVLIVGFSSQKICDSQLLSLNTIKEDFFLSFHKCEFHNCNLSNIESDRIRDIGIFHSSFGNAELSHLVGLKGLRSIKLVDTEVTSSFIFGIRQKNRKLKILK